MAYKVLDRLQTATYWHYAIVAVSTQVL